MSQYEDDNYINEELNEEWGVEFAANMKSFTIVGIDSNMETIMGIVNAPSAEEAKEYALTRDLIYVLEVLEHVHLVDIPALTF